MSATSRLLLQEKVPSQNRNFFSAKIKIRMDTYKERIHGGLARSLLTTQINLSSNSYCGLNCFIVSTNSWIVIVSSIHNFDSETRVVLWWTDWNHLSTVKPSRARKPCPRKDLRSSLYAESRMRTSPICLISLNRRNRVETIYFPNFCHGSKINWPKYNNRSNIEKFLRS